FQRRDKLIRHVFTHALDVVFVPCVLQSNELLLGVIEELLRIEARGYVPAALFGWVACGLCCGRGSGGGGAGPSGEADVLLWGCMGTVVHRCSVIGCVRTLEGMLATTPAQTAEDVQRAKDDDGDQQQAGQEFGCRGAQAQVREQGGQTQTCSDAGDGAKPARSAATSSSAGSSRRCAARCSRGAGRALLRGGALRLRRSSRRCGLPVLHNIRGLSAEVAAAKAPLCFGLERNAKHGHGAEHRDRDGTEARG